MTDFEEFCEAVGESGPVCVRGGGTHWQFGGSPSPATREVMAPAGVESYDPAEMTVRVGAGTPLAELSEVMRATGQETTLEGPEGCTVGGVLAVGRSSLRRARVGAVADTLLQAKCVGADGKAFIAGGPTVKNVTGYDLCRLLVGSLGTIALMGSVLLRTRPTPEFTSWMEGDFGPEIVMKNCYRPACLLWNGQTTTVQLEGYEVDVREEVRTLERMGFWETDGLPDLPPFRSRWSGHLPNGGILEVGNGVVYQREAVEPPSIDLEVSKLAHRVKEAFDPANRLNPDRNPYREWA